MIFGTGSTSSPMPEPNDSTVHYLWNLIDTGLASRDFIQHQIQTALQIGHIDRDEAHDMRFSLEIDYPASA